MYILKRDKVNYRFAYTLIRSKSCPRSFSSLSGNMDFSKNDFSLEAIFFSVLHSSLNYINQMKRHVKDISKILHLLLVQGRSMRKNPIETVIATALLATLNRNGHLIEIFLEFLEKHRSYDGPTGTKFILQWISRMIYIGSTKAIYLTERSKKTFHVPPIARV